MKSMADLEYQFPEDSNNRPSIKIDRASQIMTNSTLCLTQMRAIIRDYAEWLTISESSRRQQVSKRTIKLYHDTITRRMFQCNGYRYFFDWPYATFVNFKDSSLEKSLIWSFKKRSLPNIARFRPKTEAHRMVLEARFMSEFMIGIHEATLPSQQKTGKSITYQRLKLPSNCKRLSDLIAITGPLNQTPTACQMYLGARYLTVRREFGNSAVASANTLPKPPISKRWWLRENYDTRFDKISDEEKNKYINSYDLYQNRLAIGFWSLKEEALVLEPIESKLNWRRAITGIYSRSHPNAIEAYSELPFTRWIIS